MSEPPLIALEALRRVYAASREASEVIALDGVTLEIPAGQFVALVGASGSGKSTLLNVLCGIDRISGGTVRVGGHPVHALKEPALTHFRRRTFGFIFQFFNLLPTLTVLENVLLPARFSGPIPAPTRARALELLTELQIAERAQSHPDQLSGGQQQRVAICRALINDPPILLADEPTGNLDSETGAAVLDLLAALHRERGKTLLLVTHDREAAARAERIVTLRDGKVAS